LVVGFVLTGLSLAVRASMWPAIMALPLPGLYSLPTEKATTELPFRVV
jgi:hypothetical protein